MKSLTVPFKNVLKIIKVLNWAGLFVVFKILWKNGPSFYITKSLNHFLPRLSYSRPRFTQHYNKGSFFFDDYQLIFELRIYFECFNCYEIAKTIEKPHKSLLWKVKNTLKKSKKRYQGRYTTHRDQIAGQTIKS